jgi:periplasmic copper chaperone A
MQMPFKLSLHVALTLLAVVAVTAPGRHAFASEFKAGNITVETPWSRATPGGAKVGAGYLTIKNNADAPDRLVSVTADIAGKTEIHQMSMTGGMMKMRELADGLPVPAKGSVALEPSSYHLMFLDLRNPLKEGDTFKGTLTFEKAGAVPVTFEVMGIGAPAPDDDADHHH